MVYVGSALIGMLMSLLDYNIFGDDGFSATNLLLTMVVEGIFLIIYFKLDNITRKNK